MTALSRPQRLTGVTNANRFTARNLAAVPQIALARRQQLFRGGHQNVICRLPLVALLGLNDPAQARLGSIHTQRLDSRFAAEAGGGDGSRS